MFRCHQLLQSHSKKKHKLEEFLTAAMCARAYDWRMKLGMEKRSKNLAELCTWHEHESQIPFIKCPKLTEINWLTCLYLCKNLESLWCAFSVLFFCLWLQNKEGVRPVNDDNAEEDHTKFDQVPLPNSVSEQRPEKNHASGELRDWRDWCYCCV